MAQIFQNKTFIAILVIAVIALGNAGSTLYLPALIDIGDYLHGTSSEMQITLACYLISFGVSQLFYGPLSDAFGRRVILLTGVIIFMVGGVIVADATTVSVFMIGRLIQGLGIGAGNSVGFAIIRDLYTGSLLSKLLSYVAISVGMVPIIAPSIGGCFVEYMNWKACFWFLSIAALILSVLICFFLPETNKKKNPDACKPGVALLIYLKLLKNRTYVGYVLCASFAYSALISINAMLPFLIMDKFKISPSEYGLITIITGCGYLAGAYFSGLISVKLGRLKAVMLAIAIQIIAVIVSFAIDSEDTTLVCVVAPLILSLCGVGIIVPTGTSGSMDPFPEIAGSEAALLGVVMYSFSSIFSVICSYLPTDNQVPMLILLFIISLLTLLSMKMIKKDI